MLTPKARLNAQRIEKIAKELGLKFVRIKNFKSPLLFAGPGARDPSTIYLLDPGHSFTASSCTIQNEMDARLLSSRTWSGLDIDYRAMTRAALIKHLEDVSANSATRISPALM